MIFSLILVFFLAMVVFLSYFFQEVFVRGKVLDITAMQLSAKSKLKKQLVKMKTTLEEIEQLPYSWQWVQAEDGVMLAGRLFAQPGSRKMMILFHGYRSVAENDFSVYFNWYYQEGFSILLVDQRAHGRSEGKYITFGVKERYDCQKWCQYVAEKIPEIEEILLGGMSMGSTTILLATALELPPQVKGIIADCGFTSPKEIIQKVANYEYGIDARVFFPFLRWLCRLRAGFDLNACNTIEAMQQNDIPVLLVHGLSDDFVPSKMSLKNFEACRAPKQLVTVDCVNHGLSCVQDREKVHSAIQEFIKSLA